LSSSQKDKDIVDELGIFRAEAEGTEKLKEKVEDTASPRLTIATGASLTTDPDRAVTYYSSQKAQNIVSDSTTWLSINPPPSISITPLPLVVITSMHTPHMPTLPAGAEETDTAYPRLHQEPLTLSHLRKPKV